MSSSGKDPKHSGEKRPRPKGDNIPANPVAEREPGEMARTDNTVKARDAFGAPRMETGWTPEAIASKTRRPSFEGAEDAVVKEHSGKLKI